MNNVADLELCKELYELSGWTDTEKRYVVSDKDTVSVETGFTDFGYGKLVSGFRIYPAYDLGYLLRKLPEESGVIKHLRGYPYFTAYNGSKIADNEWLQTADTPEDALCKLAIELFKKGVLTQEGVNRE